MKIFCLFLATLTLSCLQAKSPGRPGKDFALFFAVCNYDEWNTLKYPIQDAEKIADELREQYDFATEIVRNPTLDQIFDKIDEYRKKAYAEDSQLLIYFSGHGDYNEATRIGYFAPRDARKEDRNRRSYFEYPILKREVFSIPCNHVLLAIDACYSGTIDERLLSRGGNISSRPEKTEKTVEQVIREQLKYKSRLCVTSGTFDLTPDKSSFVERFLLGLRTGTQNNPVLTFSGLNSFLEFANPKPYQGRLEGDEGGDFLFVPAKKTTFPPASQKVYELPGTFDQAVNQVLEAVGLNLVGVAIESTEVDNIRAAANNGKPYLLYNSKFFYHIKTRGEQWVLYGIIAHEMGHHVYKHNLSETNPIERKQMELQADQFAGSTMRLMGATLEEAKQYVSFIPIDGPDEYHLAISARHVALATGWTKRDEFLRN